MFNQFFTSLWSLIGSENFQQHCGLYHFGMRFLHSASLQSKWQWSGVSTCVKPFLVNQMTVLPYICPVWCLASAPPARLVFTDYGVTIDAYRDSSLALRMTSPADCLNGHPSLVCVCPPTDRYLSASVPLSACTKILRCAQNDFPGSLSDCLAVSCLRLPIRRPVFIGFCATIGMHQDSSLAPRMTSPAGVWLSERLTSGCLIV